MSWQMNGKVRIPDQVALSLKPMLLTICSGRIRCSPCLQAVAGAVSQLIQKEFLWASLWPAREAFFYFFRWGNWGLDTLWDLQKVTPLSSIRAGTGARWGLIPPLWATSASSLAPGFLCSFVSFVVSLKVGQTPEASQSSSSPCLCPR